MIRLMRILTPIGRLTFELILLVVIVESGIRELSDLAIALIIWRLIISCLSRILPGLLPGKFEHTVAGVTICFFKIGLEIGIFFSLRENVNIPMDFVVLILFLMSLRNVSDTFSFLAIGFDE